MAPVLAVIFAADELLDPASPAASPDELAAAIRAAARHHPVWVVGNAGLALAASAPRAVRWAPSLDAIPSDTSAARDGAGTVLVVGSRPQRSARFANQRGMAAVLIAAEAGPSDPGGMGEVPDFILPAVSDVILLIRRMERDGGDFQGTE